MKIFFMTYLIIFTTMTTVVIADFYSARYDDFDIQPLLENERILLSYTKCFLDQGPCTPEAKDFKMQNQINCNPPCSLSLVHSTTQIIFQVVYTILPMLHVAWLNDPVQQYQLLWYLAEAIPEALETTCGKCTAKQKQLIRTVIRALMEKQPQAWDQLVEKYDKEKKFRDGFNNFIEERV